VATTTEGEHEDDTMKDIAGNNEMQELQHGDQDQLKERRTGRVHSMAVGRARHREPSKFI